MNIKPWQRISVAERSRRALGYVLGVLFPDDAKSLIADGVVRYCRPREIAGQSEGCLILVSCGFFDESYGTDESLPKVSLKTIEGVPIIFGEDRAEVMGAAFVVHADVIASSFFLLTRYEEMIRRDVRDDHGRFPGRASLAWRAGFLHRPIVDEYRELMRGWLATIGFHVEKDTSRFSVCLTHDIDYLERYGGLCDIVGTIRRSKGIANRFGETVRHLLTWSGLRRDPFDNIDDVVSLDEQLWKTNVPVAASPIFFFQAGSPLDETSRYDVFDRKVRAAMEQVKAGGARVGLHASLAAGREPALIGGELEKVTRAWGGEIRANRHHYLAWREIEDGYDLAAAGVRDDYTLGFADVAGFRMGTCRPFPLFDPVRFQYFGITEHPLAVMECTLVWERYMGMDEEDALRYCVVLAEAARAYGGELVILWHNTELAEEWAPGMRRLYSRLLSELKRLIESQEEPMNRYGETSSPFKGCPQ